MTTTKYICIHCVGDLALRAKLTSVAEKRQRKCSYCGKRGKVATIDALVNLVKEPIEASWTHGEDQPSFDLGDDSDRPSWSQSGAPLTEVVEAELEVDGAIADEVAQRLCDLEDPFEYEPFHPSEISDAFFSMGQRYERRYVSARDVHARWHEFSQRVKHQRRFFDDESRSILADILGDGRSEHGPTIHTVTIGPGERVSALYRARSANSDADAAKVARSASELGRPPSALARAGRMNSSGVSMFYGAVGEKAAISEVRQSVGGLVVVGCFDVLQPLRLLDLARLGMQRSESIFADDYYKRAQRNQFLSAFHGRIVRPILPNEQEIEYLPTQAVAEYVAAVIGVDGIIYRSVQLGDDSDFGDPDEVRSEPLSDDELAKHNVVLFGEAGTEKFLSLRGQPVTYSIAGIDIVYRQHYFSGREYADLRPSHLP